MKRVATGAVSNKCHKIVECGLGRLWRRLLWGRLLRQLRPLKSSDLKPCKSVSWAPLWWVQNLMAFGWSGRGYVPSWHTGAAMSAFKAELCKFRLLRVSRTHKMFHHSSELCCAGICLNAGTLSSFGDGMVTIAAPSSRHCHAAQGSRDIKLTSMKYGR